MSSKDISIQVRGLGKKYRIGGPQEKYLTFRDAITNSYKAPLKRLTSQGAPPEFWALKDVSFDVEQGEVVGIIGRNGAGKSTLLKILSRITTPTEGTVDLYGRVGSLLEVGTGFHPELTGRENIFLSGSILGMKKREIEGKFDEIVKFSEIEKFLETPVKRYSSGMYVRLAFAVAAHLDPEILLVDEVLAVGDAAFQKKCLGKMGEVAKEGRTVLFVSHNMGSIIQLCTTAMLFDQGKIIQTGLVQDVARYYMDLILINKNGYFVDIRSPKNKDICIIKAQTFDFLGNPSSNFMHTEEIVVSITCKINRWISGSEIGISLRNSKVKIFTTDTKFPSKIGSYSEKITFSVIIPAGLLRPGKYFFSIATYLPNLNIIDSIDDALSMTVVDGGSKYAANEGLDYGCVFVDCKWNYC